MAQNILKRMQDAEYRILEAIVEESGGDDMSYVDQQTIADKTGIDFAEITRVTGPMMNRGLINARTFAYAITYDGMQYLRMR